MTRTDRYVLREALVPLILSLLIATVMIILLQLQQELGGAGRSGMSPDLLGMRVLRALPQVISLAMPIACALGCSLAANRISRDNETIAMRAAGLRLPQIHRSLTVMGAVLAIIALGLTDLAPRIAAGGQPVFASPQETLFAGALPDAKTKQLVAFSASMPAGKAARQLIDVIIVKGTSVITAPIGIYTRGHLMLKGGVVHAYGPKGMLQSEEGFALRDVPVTLDFVSVPSLIGGDASTRTLFELATMSRAARNQGDVDKLNGLEASLWFRIALPTMCLAFAIICPPLAIRFSQAGSFAGILISIILAFVTWNTLLLLQAASGAGLLPAPLSAFIPHLLTACGAAWLYRSID